MGRACRGRRGDGDELHHIGHLAFFQAMAEVGGIAVAGVRDDTGGTQAPPTGSSIMSRASCHFSRCPTRSGTWQRRPPLRSVRRPRTRAGTAASPPGTRHVGDQVHRHADLAFGDLPAVPVYCRATPTEAVAVLGEAGVVDRPRLRPRRRPPSARQAGPAPAASHGLLVTKCCSAWSCTSPPSRAAIGSTDLRRPSSISPRR